MDEPETDLQMAERHVEVGEARVARQLLLVRKLDAEGRHTEAHVARELLATLTDTLNAARRHLQIERRVMRC